MAKTTADIITELDTFVGDSSTDRISAAERLQAISEGTVWVMEELGNDLQNFTHELDYFETVNYYKVTTDLADLLDGGDLRRGKDDQTQSISRKSSRELAVEIAAPTGESSWCIDRRDNDTYIAVNHSSKYGYKLISGCNGTTDGGGTWALDETTSDATNLTIDTNEFKEGTASFNFDLDVSQSTNNRATITNSTLNDMNLSSYEDISSFLMWIYVPDVTNFTSITLFIGSDSSNYWSATATTDVDGSAWSDGWNRVKIDWEDMTATSSPDEEAVDYVRIDFNYGAGQGDDTDYRLDDFQVVRPEKLTFHYITWKLGVDSSGDDVFAYGATTDVPYYSGSYDQMIYPIAHKAASIVFRNLRLFDEMTLHENEATKTLSKVKRIIPSAKTPEVKNFKIFGLNFNNK